MPKFNIIVQRTREETCEITITAKDEETATERADKLINAEGFADKQDWELDDERFEIYEVNEE